MRTNKKTGSSSVSFWYNESANQLNSSYSWIVRSSVSHTTGIPIYLPRNSGEVGESSLRIQLHLQRSCSFIALIHPVQWTIANPVGADQPAKHQKKTSCVSTSRLVPVLCTRKVAHRTSFLSRQIDVIASFSFGACTVQTCFQHLQSF